MSMSRKEQAVVEAALELVALWGNYGADMVTDEERSLLRAVRNLKEHYEKQGDRG